MTSPLPILGTNEIHLDKSYSNLKSPRFIEESYSEVSVPRCMKISFSDLNTPHYKKKSPSGEKQTLCEKNATKNETTINHTKVSSPKESHKIALVLDIDECLIHSLFNERTSDSQHERSPQSTRKLENCFEITMEDGEKAVVNKRPGLDEFLLKCSQEFDVYAYTAASKSYMHPLLNQLDPNNNLFKKRFYRDSCIVVEGRYLKDLTVIRRDLSRVILVDNNPVSFVLHPNNGIPVPSFYGNAQDDTLFSVYKVLQGIKQCGDVRPPLQQMFKLANVLERNPDFVAVH